MTKKRLKPSDVAVSCQRNWYDSLDKEDRKWVDDVVFELAKIQYPAYWVIAGIVINELKLESVTLDGLARSLKRKVKCVKKTPQRSS